MTVGLEPVVLGHLFLLRILFDDERGVVLTKFLGNNIEMRTAEIKSVLESELISLDIKYSDELIDNIVTEIMELFDNC